MQRKVCLFASPPAGARLARVAKLERPTRLARLTRLERVARLTKLARLTRLVRLERRLPDNVFFNSQEEVLRVRREKIQRARINRIIQNNRRKYVFYSPLPKVHF